MLNRIQRVMDSMPAGGLALHGTSYKKARAITETGLLGNGYICPIPNPNSSIFRLFWGLPPMRDPAFRSLLDGRKTQLPSCLSPSEFFPLVVGSILFSMSYSFSEKHRNSFRPMSELRPTPAVVIFADWDSERGHFNLPGDDVDIRLPHLAASLDNDYYLSLGKANRNSPPQEVCAIAHLSGVEMAEFNRQARRQLPGEYSSTLALRLKKDALLLKTLQLIERLALEGKPSEILEL